MKKKRTPVLWTPGIGNKLNPTATIYFVQGETTKRIKIGFTVNVTKRLMDMQQGSPDRLTLLWCYIAVIPHESELHRHFARWRVHGEWFEPHESLLRYIKNRKPGQLTKPKAP